MKYYIIAGEASGDLHGSNLIKELKKLDASAVIRCWGGDKMQQAGGELVKHYRELAFMGFWEVIKNIFLNAAVSGHVAIVAGYTQFTDDNTRQNRALVISASGWGSNSSTHSGPAKPSGAAATPRISASSAAGSVARPRRRSSSRTSSGGALMKARPYASHHGQAI